MVRVTSRPEHLTYSFSSAHQAVARVGTDEEVVVETLDASGGQMRSDAPGAPDVTRFLPTTGPLYVEGAEPGDAIGIDIVDIRLAQRGHTWVRPGLGVSEAVSDAHVVAVSVVQGNSTAVVFDGRIEIPARPMVGTMGVAPPPGTETPTRYPGPHGGNLDIKELGPGARLWLGVHAPGALVSMGDVHAAMGDGEICGTGVETAAEVTVRFQVLKAAPMPYPVVETASDFYFLGDARTVEGAARIPLQYVRRLLARMHDLRGHEADMLISAACDLKICQMVNGNSGVALRLPKSLMNTDMHVWSHLAATEQ